MASLLEPFAGRSAKAASEQLIAHFGGLGRALLAPQEKLEVALADHAGLAEKIIAARRLFEAGLHEQIERSRVSADDPHYRRYLRFKIGKSPVELLHATFVTADWRYIADDQIATGTPAQVGVNLRFLLSRAFDVGAHGILLAHNHPSGSIEPSASDIALTHRVARLTRAVGVELLDHLIVSDASIASMKAGGVL